MRKQVIDFLQMFNYKFEEQADEIRVYIDPKLIVTLTFHDDSFTMTDKTVSWNPLSGVLGFGIRSSLVYSSWALLLALVFQEVSKSFAFKYDYTFLIAIVIALNFLWFFYFLIKVESFKSQLAGFLRPNF